MYKYRTHQIIIAGITLLFLIILTYSCISDFNAVAPASSYDILVVEGDIIENSESVFNLSTSFSLNSKGPKDENREIVAKLTIVGSDGYQSEPAVYLEKGAFKLTIGELKDDVSYGIQIEYNNNTYHSKPSPPLHTPEIDSISWMQPASGADRDVRFMVSTNGSSNESRCYKWNYTEDWEYAAVYRATFFYDINTRTFSVNEDAPYYYCWDSHSSDNIIVGTSEKLAENRMINKQIFQIRPRFLKFSSLYALTLQQRSISKEAYEYYQTVKKLNEDMGSLFAPQPAEVEGNISCRTNPEKKAIGYINVLKNVTQKRIFISPAELSSRELDVRSCEFIEDTVAKIYMKQNNLTVYDYYMMGFRPINYVVYYSEDSWKEPDRWAYSENCTNCMLNGGKKKKPDFWPNNLK